MKSHSRHLLAIIALSFAAQELSAQKLSLSGTVTTGQEPAAGATLVVRSSSDSSKTSVAYAFSDQDGKYVLTGLTPGVSHVEICAADALSRLDTVLALPATGGMVTLDFALRPVSDNLDAAVVSASVVRPLLDGQVRVITPEDRKHASSGLDVVRKTPLLRYDHQNRKLAALGGGTLKILIDGAPASEQQLLALPPSAIAEVRVHDIPPAKYYGCEAVVNVITREKPLGVSGGVFARSAFTTGFADGNLFVNATFAAFELSLDWQTSFRNYRHDREFNTYSFLADTTPVSISKTSVRRFGYWYNTANLTLKHARRDGHLFQATVSGMGLNYHGNRQASLISERGTVWRSSVMEEADPSWEVTPSVDLYYAVPFSKGWDLSANVVGTWHRAAQDDFSHEWLPESSLAVFSDSTTQRTRKGSVIAEFEVGKQMGASRLCIGNLGNYAHLHTELFGNLSGGAYETVQARDFLYGEYGFTARKFSTRLRLGAQWLYDKAATLSRPRTAFLFKPDALVTYRPTSTLALRLHYSMENEMPSIADLTPYARQLDENTIQQGNPHLTHSTTHTCDLSASGGLPFLSGKLSLSYAKTLRPIHSYFQVAKGKVYLFNENARNLQTFKVELTAELSPFPNRLLTLGLQGFVRRSFFSGVAMANYAYTDGALYYFASLNIGKLSLEYTGNLRTWLLSGLKLSIPEPHADIYLSFNHKELTITALVLNLFRSMTYESKTIPVSPVQSHSTHTIQDNNRMVALGVSWHFSTGKQFQGGEKTMHHQDTDSGLFK